MGKSRLGISILNMNGLKDTVSLLGDLQNQEEVELSILVIDNGSKDRKEVEQISKLYPMVHIVRNEQNAGVAKGFNQGIRFLRSIGCTRFLLLNNDTRIENPLFFRDMQKRFDDLLIKYDNKVVLHPLTLFSDSEDIWFYKGKINKILLLPVHIGKNRSYKQFRKNKFEEYEDAGDFLPGCCIMFDLRFIEQVGEYKESLFAYYEDLDISIRARKAGYKLIVDNQNILIHKRGGTTVGKNSKKFSRAQIYLWSRNSISVVREHFGIIKSCWLFCTRPILFIFWFIKAENKKMLFLDMITGTLDGITGKLNLSKYL